MDHWILCGPQSLHHLHIPPTLIHLHRVSKHTVYSVPAYNVRAKILYHPIVCLIMQQMDFMLGCCCFFFKFTTFFTYAESPLPKRASQTADIKVKQPSLKDEKPSLHDIKPKMELLPKKEPKGFKTEPKEEVEEDVKFKEVFSVSVDKGDLMEQLVAKNKLLAEQIAEKDQQITNQANQIAEQAKQLTEKDKQIVKYQQMYEGLMQG